MDLPPQGADGLSSPCCASTLTAYNACMQSNYRLALTTAHCGMVHVHVKAHQGLAAEPSAAFTSTVFSMAKRYDECKAA